jgi:hypothetical protein
MVSGEPGFAQAAAAALHVCDEAYRVQQRLHAALIKALLLRGGGRQTAIERELLHRLARAAGVVLIIREQHLDARLVAADAHHLLRARRLLVPGQRADAHDDMDVLSLGLLLLAATHHDCCTYRPPRARPRHPRAVRARLAARSRRLCSQQRRRLLLLHPCGTFTRHRDDDWRQRLQEER